MAVNYLFFLSAADYTNGCKSTDSEWTNSVHYDRGGKAGLHLEMENRDNSSKYVEGHKDMGPMCM